MADSKRVSLNPQYSIESAQKQNTKRCERERDRQTVCVVGWGEEGQAGKAHQNE